MIDTGSRTWLTVHQYCTGRLANLRKALEDPSKTHDQTQAIRGQIAEVKRLLDLPTLADQATDALTGDPPQ